MEITRDILKAFARYDISGEVLECEDLSEGYQMTLDDLKEVVRKLDKNREKKYAKFTEEWMQYITFNESISEAIGLDKVMEEFWECEGNLLKTDKDVMSYFFRCFSKAEDEYYSDENYDKSIEDSVDLDRIKTNIENYENNKNKPLTEWEFTDDIKEMYVKHIYAMADDPEGVSEDEVVLFKRYVDELIARDNVTALRIKGYLCYGDSSFYKCDWLASRDCLERAFEIEKDPFLANTLGYIYYYGRCNDGKPQYEEAFKYYSYGRANHLYESTYKLADMYRKGRGTFQSRETANEMIDELYGYAFKDFCKGYSDKLADVALRMGGINEEDGDVNAAHYYYLMAYYALNRRLKYNNYGDSVVLKSIQEGLARTEEKIKIKDKKTATGNWRVLAATVNDDYVCHAKVKELNKDLRISLQRLPKRSEEEAMQMLLDLHEYNFITLTDKIDIYVNKEEQGIHLPEEFRFDNFDIVTGDEDEPSRVVFLLFGKVVAIIPKNFKYKLR